MDPLNLALLAVVVGALVALVGLGMSVQSARSGRIVALGPARRMNLGLAVFVTGLVALIVGAGGIAFAVLNA